MSSTTNLNTDSTLTLEQGNPKFKDLSFKNKLVFIKDTITVEPLLCCYIMPSLIASITVHNLAIQMACNVNLNYNETICSELLSVNNSEYEKQVQVKVTSMIPWKTILSTSVPAIMVLFLGSYSDRHKRRKPFLLTPIFGEFISTICFIFCAINITRWPMEVQGISESLFPAFTGGFTTMMMAVYSYVADVTTKDSRTLRIGIVHIVAAAISLIGYSMSGILYETIGFFGIFTISIVLYIIALSYGVFYLKESRTTSEDNTEKINVCVDLFNPKHIKDTIVVIFKKRRGSERLRIVLLMVTFIVIIGPSHGENGLTFYFTRTQFQWGSIEFSLYSVYDIIIHLIGSTLAISILSQWLKLDDLLLAAIACISKVAASFLYAFSKTPTLFYFAPFVSILSGSGAIAMRSIATKLVAQDELGKIQSLFGICEAIAPIIYTNIYSNVYIATIHVLPGAFYLMGAALITPAIFILFAMYILQKRDAKKMDEDKQQDTFKYTIPINEM